jgi:hypothetical protein
MRSNYFKAALAFCAIAVIALTSSLSAQNRKLDFTLVNKTGLTIEQVFVSPSDDDEWGEDIMGKDVLKNNESVDITFSRKETTCSWDLKIVDAEEDSIEWTKLNLCTANEITLKYEGKHPTAIIK